MRLDCYSASEFSNLIRCLVPVISEMAMGLNRFHEVDRRDSEAVPRARAELDQLRANLLKLRDEARSLRQTNEKGISVLSSSASKDIGAWDDDSSIENIISAVLESTAINDNDAFMLQASIASNEDIPDSGEAPGNLDQDICSVSLNVLEEPSALSNNNKQQENDAQFFTGLRAKFRDLYPLLLAVPFAGETFQTN